MAQHTELASGKWFQLSLAEQLGNVGSEYDRAVSWLSRNNQAQFNSAFARFIELLDLTISDPRWSVFRKRELLRLREISCEGFFGDRKEDGLQKYFYQFALLARKNK